LDEEQLMKETTTSLTLVGMAWDYERWWYKLAHVFQRWRYLILGSASYLRLCLVCTPGTPLVDMLAHSPPLPLVIYYNFHGYYITEKDKEGINLALRHHDRVRRINLRMPAQSLQRFLMANDNEFPILEDLMLALPPGATTNFVFPPRIFQAPQLRRLILINFSLIGFPLLTTATGIVALSLTDIHPSAYFPPNGLIQQLSQMPQLQVLKIGFRYPIPSRVERQLLQTPITTPVILPNLHQFIFRGNSDYLEALLPQMVLPLLEVFHVIFFHQPTFSVPCLLQFMNTTESLRCSDANVNFFEGYVCVGMRPSRVSMKHTFKVAVLSRYLDQQVSSITQILSTLDIVFSAVQHLTLPIWEQSQSSEVHDEVDRTQWHRLFRSFSNVKTLLAAGGFERELSRFLRLDDGESPMELFPELNELSVPPRADVGDAFASFVDARRNTHRPVTLVHRKINVVVILR
jgi:hypothetical protein